VSLPFVALWRTVGALALIEASHLDDVDALLAMPPTETEPGSFLAVAEAAVRASIVQLGDADGVDHGWREVLAEAERNGYRMLVVDAFEALAARSTGEPRVAGRLLGAAEHLRDELGYRHRFDFQQAWVDAAAASAEPLSRAEGAQLDWRVVAEWVRRSWGDRHRPKIGWVSLTPTERRVVDLVTSGLTNPEIADQLLMSRSTVKTHLAHVFAKVGVRTRTELATALHHREDH